jgi:phenylalanyl-tRNA synthetase alpha chain
MSGNDKLSEEYNLQNHEILLLKAIIDGKKYSVDELVSEIKIDQSAIVRASLTLSKLGFVSIYELEDVCVNLTAEGEDVVLNGLPEAMLLDFIKDRKSVNLSDINISNKNVAIGWAKKKGLINIVEGKVIFVKDCDKSTIDALNNLSKLSSSQLNELKSRKYVEVDKKVKRFLNITKEGIKAAEKLSFCEEISTLDSRMIKSGAYKNKLFRSYDVSLDVNEVYSGRKHPFGAIIDLVRDIFVEMGFVEMKGPWVETAFWCMDSMWIPQDHPAREVQDTFYLPYKGKLPAKSLVDRVIDAHENGGDTGSKGYTYKWDSEMAKKLVLRTHTTATTYRSFHFKNIKKLNVGKYFCIDRVFRNEAIDATHLPEFHQVEGFVVADGLSLKHLMGFIKEFYSKMGIHKIRFKLTYNPYTEPSLEAMYYHEKWGKWLELINSGMFRPESKYPYSIDKPIIAWGLGLERLAMTLYELDKLKDIFGATCDLDWLRKYKIPIRRDD